MGDVLAGKYVLEELIGKGGMGIVYRAMQMPLERHVAIKVARPELAGHAAIRARLRTEAIAAARVVHRNVIAILDYDERQACLVMPYVNGRRLGGAVAKARPRDLQRIRAVFDQVLAALAATHARGIVHGDVKSDNVLLSHDDGDDHITLIDFGLARIPDHPRHPAEAVSGTPEYLAPEVIDGGEPSAVSDLYGAGIMLYELIAGVTPFGGGDACLVLARQLDEPVPPLRDRCPDRTIPDALERLVMHALQKDPRQRIARATAFRQALNAIALAPEQVAPALHAFDCESDTIDMPRRST